MLHPSCGLDSRPDWVIFNEFVQTRQSYIRTVSVTKLEWCAFRTCYLTLLQHFLSAFRRLIDLAPNYFEPSSFPEGEMRSALERFLRMRTRQTGSRGDDPESNVEPREEPLE
jgi:pre-mRNA-splicing factor ATP-dependent RNA helicase DHX15/PRP43